MTLTVVVFVVLLIILLWLRIDYKLGRKNHLKKINKREYPPRKSSLKLFTNGEVLFENYFTEIKNAKDHIHVLFYIVKDDDISREFLHLLKKKAEEGVDVRLLVDWVGSKISKQMRKELKKSGVHLHFCHRPTFPYFFYTLNARNHRKITVIDGKFGYVGGFNVGKEYLGRDPKYGLWRDYHLKIEGEGVQDLQKQFLYDWQDATNLDLTSDPTFFPPLQAGQIKMKVVPTDGAYLQSHFLELIKTAEKEITIGSPYFIPGSKIMNGLLEALKRGVKVNVLIPKKADHAFVKDAAYPYFSTLMQAGGRILLYIKGFYHSKVFIIDDIMCDIGTANFDKRSLYLNHEINCYIYDPVFIKLVKEKIQEDMVSSTELTINDLKNRTFLQKSRESLSTLLSHFL